MGTWGPAIKSNDTSSDVYEDFYEMYNSGEQPADITKKLSKDYESTISNPDDCNNFWFALALAQWETKSLDPELHEKVNSLIESGKDLAIWEELGAEKSELKKRAIALDKFTVKLNTEKKKPRARKVEVVKDPIFKKGTCLTFKLENGNYGGAVVLEEDYESGQGYNLIVSTRINQTNKPTLSDFKKAQVLVISYGNRESKPKVTWYAPTLFEKEYSGLFETVGTISVERDYRPNGPEISASFSSGWQHIIEPVNAQIEHERNHSAPNSIKLSQLTKVKWWTKWLSSN